MLLLEFFAFWTGLYACAAMHEAGHWLAGSCQGGRVRQFRVGGGNTFTWVCGTCVLSVGAHPFGGYCLQEFPAATRSWDFARRDLWLSLGGPLASLVVCGALAVAFIAGVIPALTASLLAVQVWMLRKSLQALSRGVNDGTGIRGSLRMLREPCRRRKPRTPGIAGSLA